MNLTYKNLYKEILQDYEQLKAGYEDLVNRYEDGIEDIQERILTAHCIELAEMDLNAKRKMRNRAKWLLDNHGGQHEKSSV